jgi:hypothetical protein
VSLLPLRTPDSLFSLPKARSALQTMDPTDVNQVIQPHADLSREKAPGPSEPSSAAGSRKRSHSEALVASSAQPPSSLLKFALLIHLTPRASDEIRNSNQLVAWVRRLLAEFKLPHPKTDNITRHSSRCICLLWQTSSVSKSLQPS